MVGIMADGVGIAAGTVIRAAACFTAGAIAAAACTDIVVGIMAVGAGAVGTVIRAAACFTDGVMAAAACGEMMMGLVGPEGAAIIDGLGGAVGPDATVIADGVGLVGPEGDGVVGIIDFGAGIIDLGAGADGAGLDTRILDVFTTDGLYEEPRLTVGLEPPPILITIYLPAFCSFCLAFSASSASFFFIFSACFLRSSSLAMNTHHFE